MDCNPPPITLSFKNPLKNGVVGIVYESHLMPGASQKWARNTRILKTGDKM